MRQLPRSALTLLNGTVYIESADAGDIFPYHGWVLGYNATTFQLSAVWNDTPDGGDGGIWQSGAGLASDTNGNLYCLTGNGTFKQPTYDASTSSYVQGDYGDAFLKLAVDTVHTSSSNPNSNGWGLKVIDYFIPYNQLYMAEHDQDLGSGGPLLLPDSAGSATHPHLLVGAGKAGTIYMVDRNNMGRYDASTDHIVQEQANAINGSFDTPGYYNGTFYYCGIPGASTNHGQSFTVTSGSFAASKQTADTYSYPGASPIISANGAADPNAIVWCLNPGQLRAYKASDFSQEIYTSDQAAASRDSVGATCRFAVPIVADARVYVPTVTGLVVYGLLK